MVISKKQNPKCRLVIGNDFIQQVDKFSYLGSYITKNGKCDNEIKRRIEIGTGAFEKLGRILRNQKLSWSTRLRTLECYVVSTLPYR